MKDIKKKVEESALLNIQKLEKCIEKNTKHLHQDFRYDVSFTCGEFNQPSSTHLDQGFDDHLGPLQKYQYMKYMEAPLSEWGLKKEHGVCLYKLLKSPSLIDGKYQYNVITDNFLVGKNKFTFLKTKGDGYYVHIRVSNTPEQPYTYKPFELRTDDALDIHKSDDMSRNNQ